MIRHRGGHRTGPVRSARPHQVTGPANFSTHGPAPNMGGLSIPPQQSQGVDNPPMPPYTMMPGLDQVVPIFSGAAAARVCSSMKIRHSAHLAPAHPRRDTLGQMVAWSMVGPASPTVNILPAPTIGLRPRPLLDSSQDVTSEAGAVAATATAAAATVTAAFVSGSAGSFLPPYTESSDDENSDSDSDSIPDPAPAVNAPVAPQQSPGLASPALPATAAPHEAETWVDQATTVSVLHGVTPLSPLVVMLNQAVLYVNAASTETMLLTVANIAALDAHRPTLQATKDLVGAILAAKAMFLGSASLQLAACSALASLCSDGDVVGLLSGTLPRVIRALLDALPCYTPLQPGKAGDTFLIPQSAEVATAACRAFRGIASSPAHAQALHTLGVMGRLLLTVAAFEGVPRVLDEACAALTLFAKSSGPAMMARRGLQTLLECLKPHTCLTDAGLQVSGLTAVFTLISSAENGSSLKRFVEHKGHLTVPTAMHASSTNAQVQVAGLRLIKLMAMSAEYHPLVILALEQVVRAFSAHQRDSEIVLLAVDVLSSVVAQIGTEAADSKFARLATEKLLASCTLMHVSAAKFARMLPGALTDRIVMEQSLQRLAALEAALVQVFTRAFPRSPTEDTPTFADANPGSASSQQQT